MKKNFVVGVMSILFSGLTFAAACSGNTGGAQAASSAVGVEECVCNGGTAVKSTVQGGAGAVIATPIFLKNGFDVQCSANTNVSYNEVSSTGFAVGASSVKGNQSFKGSTAGGAVTTHLKCAAANCAASDTTTATTAAAADAASS